MSVAWPRRVRAPGRRSQDCETETQTMSPSQMRPRDDVEEQLPLLAEDRPAQAAIVVPLVPLEIAASRLHAYVDHALEPTERARIEALLQRRPLERVKAASYRALNVQLRALHGDRPPAMPQRLAELVKRAIDRFAACEDGAPLLRRC
jgi:anti-sigma factor RsiW